MYDKYYRDICLVAMRSPNPQGNHLQILLLTQNMLHVLSVSSSKWSP